MKEILRRKGKPQQLLRMMTAKLEKRLMKVTWNHKKWTIIQPPVLMKRKKE